MKFEHEVINIDEYLDLDLRNDNNPRKLLLLKYDTDAFIEEEIVAQAISLDIRGNYGDFLNREPTLKKQDEYNEENERNKIFIWSGNLFNIQINYVNSYVNISELLGDRDGDRVEVRIDEWNEALEGWKSLYLKEMGLLEFKFKQLSHFLGVLLLTYDKMLSPSDFCKKMVMESMKQCSNRYGIRIQTLYSECKNVLGVPVIQDFYDWLEGFFAGIPSELSENLKYKYRDEDIEIVFYKYFSVEL